MRPDRDAGMGGSRTSHGRAVFELPWNMVSVMKERPGTRGSPYLYSRIQPEIAMYVSEYDRDSRRIHVVFGDLFTSSRNLDTLFS